MFASKHYFGQPIELSETKSKIDLQEFLLREDQKNGELSNVQIQDDKSDLNWNKLLLYADKNLNSIQKAVDEP